MKLKKLEQIRSRANTPLFLGGLCLFNAVFLFLNILLFKFYLALPLFLVDAVFILLFLSVPNSLRVLLFILPFTFVFKVPAFGTSLLSVLLLVFYIRIVVSAIRTRNYGSSSSWRILGVFVLFAVYGVIVALIHLKYANIRMLPSYFLYLFLPCALAFSSDINGLWKENYFLWLIFGSLFSTFVGLAFFYVVPKGQNFLLTILKTESFASATDSGIKRFSGLNPDPNYATVLVLLPASFLLVAEMKKIERILGIACAGLSCAINLLSVSKMFIAGLAVLVLFSVTYFWIWKKIPRHFIPIVLFVAVVLVAALAATPLGQIISSRFFSSDSSSPLDHLTSNRSYLFGQYANYLLSSPGSLLFGVGPTTTGLGIFDNETHNAFLGLFFQNGLIGTMLLIAYYYLSGRTFFRIVSHPSPFFLCPLFLVVLVFSALNMETSVFTPVVISSFCLLRIKPTMCARVERIIV